MIMSGPALTNRRPGCMDASRGDAAQPMSVDPPKFSYCPVRLCGCGSAEEDFHHVLWECPKYDDLRDRLMDAITRNAEGPVYYAELVAKKVNFDRLWVFARECTSGELRRITAPTPKL
jgi:hypothetical protein